MGLSEELFDRAVKVIPGGVNSPVRAYGAIGIAPRFIDRADGCHIYDVDGKEYVDYIDSWGPMILGHNHPKVRESVLEAVQAVKAQVPDAFVLVSFAVLPDGYTREGMYCKDLARRMQEKLWQALYYRYDFAKEYRPQLEENLLWLDGELKKLEGMQMQHRIIEKSDR